MIGSEPDGQSEPDWHYWRTLEDDSTGSRDGSEVSPRSRDYIGGESELGRR